MHEVKKTWHKNRERNYLWRRANQDESPRSDSCFVLSAVLNAFQQLLGRLIVGSCRTSSPRPCNSGVLSKSSSLMSCQGGLHARSRLSIRFLRVFHSASSID